MAKKMKKLLSVVLALSMIMSLMTVNVFAQEGDPADTQSSTTTHADGSTTTETKTESTTDNKDGSTTNTSETVKETVSADGSTVKTDWESNSTTTTETDGESATTEVENVTGSKTEIETSKTNSNGNVVEKVGEVERTETTTTITGNVETTTDSTTNTLPREDETLADVTVTVKPGETVSEVVQHFPLTQEEINAQLGERPVAETKTDENGVTTEVKVNDIIGSDGKTVIGYTSTVVTKSEGTTVSHIIDNRPTDSNTTDENGQTTTIKVLDKVNDQGEVIGYETVTTVTKANGDMVSTETRTVTATQTETGAEIISTTTKEIAHKLGEMPTADRTVTVTLGETVDNGGIVIKSEIDSEFPTIPQNMTMDKFKAANDYDKIENNGLSYANQLDNDEYVALGDKLGSTIRANGYNYDPDSDEMTNDIGFLTRFFILTDNQGDKHFGYCSDLWTGMRWGTIYEREELEDSGYLSAENAANIRAVASHGYWATTEGQGSLDALKAQLKGSEAAKAYGLTDEDIDKLTHGEAIAGTQTAIWKNASSSDYQGLMTDDVAKHNSSIEYVNGPELSDKLVNAVYQYLTTLDSTPTAESTPLDKNAITSANVSVKEQEDGTLKTDVSIALSVTPSTINGDLIVKVVDANDPNNVLASKRLTTDAGTYDASAFDANNNVTFEGLTLSNGQTININLTGLQKMDDYAYIYLAQGGYGKSQTLVTLGTAEKNVDLSTTLTVNVSEPQITVNTTTTSGNHKTTVVNNSTETWEALYFYPTDSKGGGEKPPVIPPEEPSVEIPEEDVPLTDLPEEDVPLAPTPDEPEMEIPEEDVPLAELPEEEVPLAEIPDEEVPLSDVPKTGDNTMALYAMVVLAAGGLMGLTVVETKRKNEA